jgi:threonyl-tRNA synthetase
MRILALHSDFIEVEPKKKAMKEAEEIDKKVLKMDECLVVFTAVEKRDEENPESVTNKLVNEIKDITKQVKTENVMLYPYVHLTSSPSRPSVALKVLEDAEKLLKKDYHVDRAPFGWYKAFKISCKGHPLSELSREFGPGEDKIVKVVDDKSFEFNDKKLSEEDKMNFSTSLMVAKAIKEMHPKAEVGSMGFYQDQSYVDISGLNLTKDDIPKIKKNVKNLIGKILPFETSKNAEGKWQKEIAKDLGKKAKAYKLGEVVVVPTFEKPFVENTKKVAAFKILNLASAYWKNNAGNEQLSRIYSVGFKSKEELQKYEEKQEEAEKRDHRKIGAELNLFSIHDEAPGMPFFHNKGTFIFNKLVEFMTDEMMKLNYEINKTPIILNKSLWQQSGHWDHYKENMYFTNIEGEENAVKPMNCPGNLLIYKSKPHSYRELPIKAGEFGLVHRHELSGALSGLFRVRVFTQDDAHVFCTKEQLKGQIIELMDLINKIYSTFGFEYDVELSTRPAKAMGEKKLWDLAEKTLADALKAKGQKFKINAGDGAFYGPKIDFHIKDALGRSWQCGTIQLDFSMPEKFDLAYEGKDGKRQRPVMLHRAIYGSLERFMGILIEHFIGKFPLWLNPVQVKLVTINDDVIPFAEEVMAKMKANGLRVELDDRARTMGKKVREAQLEKINYIVTIGEKEVEKKKLAIRTRNGEVKFDVDIDKFISSLLKEVETKEIKWD